MLSMLPALLVTWYRKSSRPETVSFHTAKVSVPVNDEAVIVAVLAKPPFDTIDPAGRPTVTGTTGGAPTGSGVPSEVAWTGEASTTSARTATQRVIHFVALIFI